MRATTKQQSPLRIRDKSVGIGTRLPEEQRTHGGPPKCPDRLWGPPNLPLNRYRSSATEDKGAGE